MNTNIYLGDLSQVIPPSLIDLPKDYILREERCPVCNVHLHETFSLESGKPKDIMRVQIGRKYPSWLVSTGIFCPKCRIRFEHTRTNSDILKRYQKIAQSGGIWKLLTKEDFVVSLFDTPLKDNLAKHCVVYATASAVRFTGRKAGLYKVNPGLSSYDEGTYMSNFIFKIKDGYSKKNGWKKTDGLTLRNVEAWEEVPALICVSDVNSLFIGDHRITIPTDIIGLPKE